MAKARVIIGRCPECNARIEFETIPDLEQIVTCAECGELLEVVAREPLTLYWAYDFDEDSDPSEDNFAEDYYDDDDDEW